MAFKFVASQPALAPLFVAVGVAIGGSAFFASHNLRHSQDVVINRSKSLEPWNDVVQNKNTKLFSWNPDFWAGRKDLPDPRAAFLGENGSVSDAVKVAKAKAISKLGGAKTPELGKEQSAH